MGDHIGMHCRDPVAMIDKFRQIVFGSGHTSHFNPNVPPKRVQKLKHYAQCGARTHDPEIKTLVLNQLS